MITNIKRIVVLARCALLVAMVATVAPLHAQEPRVPYVPTPQDVVEKMLQVARVSAGDYLIDLGCGDGRIVVTAARTHGARGFGVDINPVRVTEAVENAQKAGVSDKVSFYQRDLFQTNLSQATVISMYLLPNVNMELRPKLLALKPGTRIVSHDFDLGDWKPDQHVRFDSKLKYSGAGGQSDIYFWVVPAQASGTWTWELPLRGKAQKYAITLSQTFQMVSGNVLVNGQRVPLQAKLAGNELRISFVADLGAGRVKHEFVGRINGEALGGTAALSGGRTQGQYDWAAVREGAKASLAPVTVSALMP